jgi:hypothetical protein
VVSRPLPCEPPRHPALPAPSRAVQRPPPSCCAAARTPHRLAECLRLGSRGQRTGAAAFQGQPLRCSQRSLRCLRRRPLPSCRCTHIELWTHRLRCRVHGARRSHLGGDPETALSGLAGPGGCAGRRPRADGEMAPAHCGSCGVAASTVSPRCASSSPVFSLPSCFRPACSRPERNGQHKQVSWRPQTAAYLSRSLSRSRLSRRSLPRPSRSLHSRL